MLRQAAAFVHTLALHPMAPLDPALPDIKACLGLFAVLFAGDLLARRKISFATLPAFLQIGIVNAGVLIVLSRWIMGHGNAPFLYYKF